MPQPTRRSFSSALRAVAASLLAALVVFAGCGSDEDDGSSTDGSGGSGAGSTNGAGAGAGDAICLLHNCHADAECGACSGGRVFCDLEENRCVACGEDTATGCPDGQVCSSWGNCIPPELTCPTDDHGTPTISCSDNADCAACDPMHLVCDTATSACVACTTDNVAECQSNALCKEGTCAPECPASCTADSDCASCGGPNAPAHACNGHKCSECSPTVTCDGGQSCTPSGTCQKLCGVNDTGVCSTDGHCKDCGGAAKSCVKPANADSGKCGVPVTVCSDLGATAVLPAPFSEITSLCESAVDCTNVGASVDVGALLRDLTGIDEISSATVEYPMPVCAEVEAGVGDVTLSCGVCVPCEVDADCQSIDIDQFALDAFGPLGSLAAAFLLDQVFGPNDHQVHMYCEGVAGGYGVCLPCPGVLYQCGYGSGGAGTGSCTHDPCAAGGPLKASCDTCTATLCAIDAYCCSEEWDAFCVEEASIFCGLDCPDGPTCEHDECTEGTSLAPDCSACATSVCEEDPYCCDTKWDIACVISAQDLCSC